MSRGELGAVSPAAEWAAGSEEEPAQVSAAESAREEQAKAAEWRRPSGTVWAAQAAAESAPDAAEALASVATAAGPRSRTALVTAEAEQADWVGALVGQAVRDADRAW